LADQRGDLDLGHRAFLASNVDSAATLPADLDGLIEEEAFVRLIPQSRKVGCGVGSFLGDLDSRQRHRALPPRRGEVQVLPVRKVERFLEGKARWLLRRRQGSAT